jgi:hypothetical protein
MDLKQILETLASIPEDQLSEEDKAMLAELAGKYATEEEPTETPAEEAAESPDMQALEAEAGIEAPMPPAKEMPAEEMPVEAEENMPAPEQMPLPEDLEAVAAEPELQNTQHDEAMIGIQNEISSLRESIEAIKKMLEGVAIREPISEEEAEKEDESVGQKGKPGKMVESEPNITDMLAKKLGGY